MKELRVLQIASGDLWAGAEVQFYNLCRKLHASRDIRLRAIVLNDGILSEELDKAGVQVTVLDEKTLSTFSILGRLARIVTRFEPDIMHSHRLKENVLSGVASLLSPGQSVSPPFTAPLRPLSGSRISTRRAIE